VVENRAGAGGNIGTQAAAQAEPDGYTILFGTTALFGVNPILYANSGVDALRDFLPLGTIAEVANILSIMPGRVPARTVGKLVAEARRRLLVYGSVGNGSSLHLSATVFLKTAAIEATHVPYRGSSPPCRGDARQRCGFRLRHHHHFHIAIHSGAFRPLAVTTARPPALHGSELERRRVTHRPSPPPAWISTPNDAGRRPSWEPPR
jgi:tripartite-type tricarboxylate transporter receptor subunit TctC